MTIRTAAAIYARISQDRAGAGQGIQRQLTDCRAEDERLGWTVTEEYVDDDISAYSGKRRPAYERMLEDITDGQRDAIIVWHIDRFHRRPMELAELSRVCARSGVSDLRTVHDAFDLASGDGMFVTRVLAAVDVPQGFTPERIPVRGCTSEEVLATGLVRALAHGRESNHRQQHAPKIGLARRVSRKSYGKSSSDSNLCVTP